MKFILAHDLGTSGNKATLFGDSGELIASRVYSYKTNYFNQTWVEQSPDDWWKAICETSRSLLEGSGTDPADVAVVSFSGQMMGCLCVDRSGTPLRPSIIWADQRAQSQTAALNEKIPLTEFYHIAGHRNSASYGLQKLMWIRDNEPDIYRRTYKVLNAKDYIIMRLTGAFCTEPSDATSMTCYDINTWQWSERIVSASGIDAAKLPDVVPSTHIAGTVTAAAAEETGLKAGTPVVMGGGDGVCANVGAGSIAPGKTFSYVGSSAWIASTAESPVFDEQMRTVTWCHLVPGMYAPNGTMQCAGGAYNWLKEQVCRFESEHASAEGVSPYKLIDAQAAASRPGSNGVIFLPYLLGERAPRWNVNARGAFLGLNMESTRADILRSVMEGVTMNLAIVLDILRKHIDIQEILVIGGGAKGRIWRQIMADFYGVPIKSPVLLEEATSMGAAITGGVGVGLFKDFGAADSFIEIADETRPDPEARAACEKSRVLFDAYYEALAPVFDKMSNI